LTGSKADVVTLSLKAAPNLAAPVAPAASARFKVTRLAGSVSRPSPRPYVRICTSWGESGWS